jgi:hypothetical protein
MAGSEVMYQKKKLRCCECDKVRDRMRPVTKHVDGWIDYVCPNCWKQFDYADFFFQIPATVN